MSSFGHTTKGSFKVCIKGLCCLNKCKLLILQVFSGHTHAYERCRRTYKFELDACAPTYVTVGDGGNIEGVRPLKCFVSALHSVFSMPCLLICLLRKVMALLSSVTTYAGRNSPI